MLIHRQLRPFIHELDEIYSANRKKHGRHECYMLYQVLLDYMRHWRTLEHTQFAKLSTDAQDELYYCFTEKLLQVFDQHLDLYWLIHDLDGQPLFSDGREPAKFWQKKRDKPENRIYRMEAL